jgi:hypothetical protein
MVATMKWRVLKLADDKGDPWNWVEQTRRNPPAKPQPDGIETEHSYITPADVKTIGERWGAGRFLMLGEGSGYTSFGELTIDAVTEYQQRHEEPA